MVKLKIFEAARLTAASFSGTTDFLEEINEIVALYSRMPQAVNFDHLTDFRRRSGFISEDHLEALAEKSAEIRARHNLLGQPHPRTVLLVPSTSGASILAAQWETIGRQPRRIEVAHTTRDGLALLTPDVTLLHELEGFLGK